MQPTVSVKNTKQEILAAYKDLIQGATGKTASPKVPTTTIKSANTHFQKAIETLIAAKGALDTAATSLEQQKLAQSQDEEQARQQLEQFQADMKRAREELDYELKRRRQEKTDELETELTAKRRQHETQLIQENEAIRQRKELLEQQEGELRELRKRADSFPKELERTIQEAIASTRTQEQNKAKVASDLTEKQTEGEQALAELKIENLEKTAKEQADEIRVLKSQLERATAQVKEVAISVIDSNRPISAPPVPKE